MASAGVARPPAVSARAIQSWAAAPPGVCTRMATSRLSTRSFARQQRMTPVAVTSSGPTSSRGRYRSGRPVIIDVIDAADPSRSPTGTFVPARAPRTDRPGSYPAEAGPDRSQWLLQLRNPGEQEASDRSGADDNGTDEEG